MSKTNTEQVIQIGGCCCYGGNVLTQSNQTGTPPSRVNLAPDRKYQRVFNIRFQYILAPFGVNLTHLGANSKIHATLISTK